MQIRSHLGLSYATVAVVSFAALAFELVQVRILSFIFWNHTVYLTISVALLGFGISGSLVAVFADKFKDHRRLLSMLLAAFALSMILAYIGCCCHVQGAEPWRILFCYMLFLPPFICAGAILSICLSANESQVGRLYAVDLLSAGLACIVFFFLLPQWGPLKLICFIAFFAAFLSFFCARINDRAIKASSVLICTISLSLFILPESSLPLLTEKYKEFYVYRNSEIEKTIWTPLCRVDVIGSRTRKLPYRYGGHWVKGPNYPNVFKVITQDGGAHTYIYSKQYIDFLRTRIKYGFPSGWRSLAYHIKKSPDVAIIGVGGGIDALYALAFNANSIIGAELNPAIYDLATRQYVDYMGHSLSDSRVRIVNEEGRSMLRQCNKKFDLIQIFSIYTFAALSHGAYVLSESYLYTAEAFQEFFDHLKDNGILCVYRWNLTPPRESLRVVSLACEAFRRLKSADIEQKIFVFGNQKQALALFKRTPFLRSELHTLNLQAAHEGLEVLYWPKVLPAAEQQRMESQYYKGVSSDVRLCSNAFNSLILSYKNGDEDQFFHDYPYAVQPSTDDKPFFFDYEKMRDFGFKHFRCRYGVAASMVLYVVLAESTILTLVAIIWPLFKFKREGMAVPHALSFSVYFASLGIGFMLIEIGLVQKCVLFLGSPLYSLSVILAALLISAGFGSTMVDKLNWKVNKILNIFGSLLLVVMGLLTYTLNPIIYSLIHLPLMLRILVTILVVSPAGILMGVFFPLGLKIVRHNARNYLPWAWGINGCASVYGSFAAIMLAIHWGFTCELLAGVLVYLIGFAAARSFAAADMADTCRL